MAKVRLEVDLSLHCFAYHGFRVVSAELHDQGTVLLLVDAVEMPSTKFSCPIIHRIEPGKRMEG